MSSNPQLDYDLHKTSIAALVFLVWHGLIFPPRNTYSYSTYRENLITLDDEVAHIWSKPWNAWIKTVFLFLRYFPLAVQLCNRIISEMVEQHKHLDFSALRAWYISQVVIAHLAMTGVEIVMMARVYALFRNNPWIGCGLILLWLAETLVVLLGLFLTLPDVHFEPALMITSAPRSFVYLAVAALVSQATILGLTLVRFLQGQWGGTSLGHLLIREGTVAYFTFFVSTMAAAIYSARGLPVGMTEYAWYLSIISTVGCRLILNMQRLPSSLGGTDSSFHRTSSLQLTTLHASHRTVDSSCQSCSLI
ncbi:hypothetical protein C8F04DRAFT_1065396 [Mycena alexandri]|uniref:DUF6533 domain-containing protein n=1 Tax=Mycena alexandri TaxID=1745969 RepID=A0AAD6XF19_9AGAR|nr:hypothetical protein C8F04DRAFT_1065396 [Mycena alexandri]